jgi:hypothetical protein
MRATVSGPPGAPVHPLLEFIAAFADGLFAVIESSPDGSWEHAHCLLLVGSQAEAAELVNAAADHFGFSRSAQKAGPGVGGWRGFVKTGDSTSLASNLHGLWSYDLCVLKHCSKRQKEIPTGAVVSGPFAALAPLAAFALDPGAVHHQPVRLCGAPLPGGGTCCKHLTGRQRTGCSGTCRSRKSRAATEATQLEMSESVAVGSRIEIDSGTGPPSRAFQTLREPLSISEREPFPNLSGSVAFADDRESSPRGAGIGHGAAGSGSN